MKKIVSKGFILVLCCVVMLSFASCGSEAKKAMDSSVKEANVLLEENAKAYDAKTKTNLEDAVKNSENAKDDEGYNKSAEEINAAITAYENSIKQLEQVTNPTEEFLLERAKKVKTITKVEAATEETDENNLLNKEEQYYSYIAMKSSLVTDSYYIEQTPVEAGAEAGAVIEAFKTVKDAKARDEYLGAFDGSGLLSSGGHKVVGTLVIRTANSLTASQQKELEQNVIDALIELK